MVLYIDVGICASGSLEEATKYSKCVRETLVSAGLVANNQKSLLGACAPDTMVGFQFGFG